MDKGPRERDGAVERSGPPLGDGGESPEFARLALDLLHRGVSVRFRAQGGSMARFIRDGEVLTVAPCDARVLRLGDVALYRNAVGRLFAHRVLRKGWANGYTLLQMRGDASRGPCEAVPADAILGRVVSARRGANVRKVDTFARRWMALCRIHLTPLPFVRFAIALRRWFTDRL